MEAAIVSLAVERISDLLVHEAVFLNDVKEEVEGLRTVLKQMKCFLEDVDSIPEQEHRLRNWVSEIRDLALDAEDVIDSCILKLGSQEGFQGTVKRFIFNFTKPFHLYKIKVQVKQIYTKLENISRSLPAYEKYSEGMESSSAFSIPLRLRRTFSYVDEDDIAGLEVSTKDVVAKLMTEEDRLHAVVSIVGMGGIGKTTLARKVYNQVDVRRYFDCSAWVFISQQCNPREVLYVVLMKVLCPSKEERELIEKENDVELMKRLSDVLKEQRYLLVLDDIWRCEDWDCLKAVLPRGRKGSKILLTTRNRNVALHADPHNSPIEPRLLTDDESWNLLRRKTFPQSRTSSHVYSKEFEKLGREMVKQCGGLPLAIVVLGSLLATKQSLAQWEVVQRNIHQLDVVKGILALSYNDLPYHLKPCFLYLGHYPKDWEISKKELIRLWIAEGFISPSSERMELLEDVGELFLEELINRSLVQIVKRDCTGTNVKTCRMNGALRDLCIEKAREERFLEIIHPPLIGYADSVDVTLAEPMLQRITIHPSKRYVCLKGKHPRLRSLLLFQNETLIKMHISECKSFKLLRVLNLVRNGFCKWHVSRKIGNLRHLKYLKLKGEGTIILPKSIGRLKDLYTLNCVCGEDIIVPNFVFELERLRHISLKTTRRRRGFLLTSFISENNETLKYIMVNKELVENKAVQRMTNVRSLGLIFKRSEDVEGILMSLTELGRLASLNMDVNSVRVSCQDLEPISQCRHLSKLKLAAKIIEEDPNRSHHHFLNLLPQSIVKLTLLNCEMKQDPMGVLEKLPHLKILKLMNDSYDGGKMICSANGFPQLDSLHMQSLNKLEEWEIEEGAMPQLRSLYLRWIPNLRVCPEGFRHITSLQELQLSNMSSALVERVKRRDGREGEDFYKVRHVPSIQIQWSSLLMRLMLREL